MGSSAATKLVNRPRCPAKSKSRLRGGVVGGDLLEKGQHLPSRTHAPHPRTPVGALCVASRRPCGQPSLLVLATLGAERELPLLALYKSRSTTALRCGDLYRGAADGGPFPSGRGSQTSFWTQNGLYAPQAGWESARISEEAGLIKQFFLKIHCLICLMFVES